MYKEEKKFKNLVRAKHHVEQKDDTQAAGWLIRFLVAGFGVVTMLGVAYGRPSMSLFPVESPQLMW